MKNKQKKWSLNYLHHTQPFGRVIYHTNSFALNCFPELVHFKFNENIHVSILRYMEKRLTEKLDLI